VQHRELFEHICSWGELFAFFSSVNFSSNCSEPFFYDPLYHCTVSVHHVTDRVCSYTSHCGGQSHDSNLCTWNMKMLMQYINLFFTLVDLLLLYCQVVWSSKWSSHAETSADGVWCFLCPCYTLHFLITASWSMAISGCCSLQHSFHVNTVEDILQPSWRISRRGLTSSLDWHQDRWPYLWNICIFQDSKLSVICDAGGFKVSAWIAEDWGLEGCDMVSLGE
jgi:hypothetical protein